MYGCWYDYVKPKYHEKAMLNVSMLNGHRHFHCLYKNLIFKKWLLKMLKQGLTLQIMTWKITTKKKE